MRRFMNLLKRIDLIFSYLENKLSLDYYLIFLFNQVSKIFLCFIFILLFIVSFLSLSDNVINRVSHHILS